MRPFAILALCSVSVAAAQEPELSQYFPLDWQVGDGARELSGKGKASKGNKTGKKGFTYEDYDFDGKKGGKKGLDYYLDDYYYGKKGGKKGGKGRIAPKPKKPSRDPSECSGHGHLVGNRCRCDKGFIMEPADPFRCSSKDWSPCKAALKGKFEFIAPFEFDLEGSFFMQSISGGKTVTYGLGNSKSYIADVYGKVQRTIEFPDLPESGITGNRDHNGLDRSVGYYTKNFSATPRELFGYRSVDGTYESAENANEDIVGYYFDGEVNTFQAFGIFDGNYTKINVPGAEALVFTWDLTDDGRVSGTAQFEGDSRWFGYWLSLSGGPNVQTISPGEDSPFTFLISLQEEAFAGYYTVELGVNAGFIVDPTDMSNYVRIDMPRSEDSFISLAGMTDRCTIAGNYDDGDGIKQFVAIPIES